ncbi:MAG: hypothetical protein KIT17_00970 [Rubrivivax sp.]|nr:hypothetical protein [Rubrivivax sp.]
MLCPKCSYALVESQKESTVSVRIYRCAGCRARFKFLTESGRLVELMKVAGAWGVVLSIVLAVIGFGGWN